MKVKRACRGIKITTSQNWSQPLFLNWPQATLFIALTSKWNFTLIIQEYAPDYNSSFEVPYQQLQCFSSFPLLSSLTVTSSFRNCLTLTKENPFQYLHFFFPCTSWFHWSNGYSTVLGYLFSPETLSEFKRAVEKESKKLHDFSAWISHYCPTKQHCPTMSTDCKWKGQKGRGITVQTKIFSNTQV